MRWRRRWSRRLGAVHGARVRGLRTCRSHTLTARARGLNPTSLTGLRPRRTCSRQAQAGDSRTSAWPRRMRRLSRIGALEQSHSSICCTRSMRKQGAAHLGGRPRQGRQDLSQRSQRLRVTRPWVSCDGAQRGRAQALPPATETRETPVSLCPRGNQAQMLRELV